jgi:hypothetical protein
MLDSGSLAMVCFRHLLYELSDCITCLGQIRETSPFVIKFDLSETKIYRE